jgi:hypothetical protein
MKSKKLTKKGRGVKDFIKKHKGKIAAAAGVLGTIGALGLASRYGKKNKPLKLDSSHPELGKFFENLKDPEPQHMGLMDPSFASYNPFLIDPHYTPYSQMGREEEKSGGGRFDDFKEWIKKNKRVLGLTAGAVTGILGSIAAIAAASGQQPAKGKIRRLQEGEKPSSQVISEARFAAPAATRPMYQQPAIEEEAKRPSHEPAIVPTPASASRPIRLKRLINPLLPAGFKRNPLQGVQGAEGFKNIYSPIGLGSCCCGRDCNEIMEKLGGYQVAQNYLMKHKEVGSGLLSDLAHKGVSKGFNLLGDYGLNLLIEVAVGLLGEEFRKDIVHLVKKYGWKSIKFIKKYAHKGIDFIKKKVEDNYGGSLCPQCNDFLDNEFRCGNIDSLEKMGEGWKEDLATGLTWFSKNVIAPAARIVPGSLGEAMAYAPSNIDKFAQLGSPGWEYKDPFEDDSKNELPSYQGAQSKPPKKGKGFVKPKPTYKTDTFEILAGLIPSRLIGKMVGETMPKIEGDFSILPERFKPKSGSGLYEKYSNLVEYIPWDLLIALRDELIDLDIPEISILPKKWRKYGKKDSISIWDTPNPRRRVREQIRQARQNRGSSSDSPPSYSSSGSSGSSSGEGLKRKKGGTKMLPKPEYTKEEKEMMILPYPDEPEPEMRIQPYPYPIQHGRPQDEFLKPYPKPYGPYGRLPTTEKWRRTKNLINPLSDPEKFKEIVKNNGGKSKKRRGGAKQKMTIKKIDANLPLMFLPEIPEHGSYSGSGPYSQLQDPNFNTNRLIMGTADNKDYKSFQVGMKDKSQGRIIIGGKKKKITKKAILKKLRFEK